MGDALDRWLLVILVIVVLVSLLPSIIHVLRHNREEVSARVRSFGRRGAVRVVEEPTDPVVGEGPGSVAR